MIFDYLSENHELVYDWCWNMFEFTSSMIIYVYVLKGFELVWLFWSLYEKNDDFGMNWCFIPMFVVVLNALLCL